MDRVPYEFVDRVFTKIGWRAIERVEERQFESPLWDRAYRNNIQELRLLILPTATEVAWFLSTYRVSNESIDYSFDELLRMDPRFQRIVRFEARRRPFIRSPIGLKTFPNDRLDELLKCVMRHPLHTVGVKDDLQRLLIMTNLVSYGAHLELVNLELCYCSESVEFLKNQLQTNALRNLELTGKWPIALKEDMLSFICRPQFEQFRYPDAKFFDIEDVERIIAYNNSLANPWRNSLIYLQNSCPELRNYFASWKASVGGGNENLAIFEKDVGRVTVIAKCDHYGTGFVIHFRSNNK